MQPRFAIYVNGTFANLAEPLTNDGKPTYFPSPSPNQESAFDSKDAAIQAAHEAGYSGFTVQEVYF